MFLEEKHELRKLEGGGSLFWGLGLSVLFFIGAPGLTAVSGPQTLSAALQSLAHGSAAGV